MDSKVIGEAIRNGRLTKNETQWTLAAKLGTTQQNISSWENGRRQVPKRYHKRLIKEYGVNFGGDIKADDRRIDCVPLSPVEAVFIKELRGVFDAFLGLMRHGVARGRRGGYRRHRA